MANGPRPAIQRWQKKLPWVNFTDLSSGGVPRPEYGKSRRSALKARVKLTGILGDAPNSTVVHPMEGSQHFYTAGQLAKLAKFRFGLDFREMNAAIFWLPAKFRMPNARIILQDGGIRIIHKP